MNDLDLSADAYDALYPRRAAARRKGRAFMLRVAQLVRILHRLWIVVAIALVFVLHGLVTRWDFNDAKDAHYAPHRIEVVR